MKYFTHNIEPDIQHAIYGTSLQEVINCPYDLLTTAFGQPTDCDYDKVDSEWIIKFSDGTIATIYDWKVGKNYLGKEGITPETNTVWHIGGFNSDAVINVMEVLDL